MSPTFQHQLFPARRRLEVTFNDGTPSIYLVDFLGEQWIDTALLPPASALYEKITGAHLRLLTEHLKIKGMSLEHIAKSAFAQKIGLFTYTAKWRLKEDLTEQMVGNITVSCGKVRSCHLDSPAVASIRRTHKIAAEQKMFIWSVEHAFSSA